MSETSIHIAQPTELPEAALLAGRANISNPLMAAVFQGKEKRLEALFMITFEKMLGEVLLAKDNEKIVGVMRIAEWPESDLTPMQQLELLPLSLMACEDSFSRASTWWGVWAQHHPKEHHWYLAGLAVLPERQRQGIGTQLLRHYCDFMDSKGAPGYLETDVKENVSYYERFGFRVIDEAPILDVPNYFMWRQKSQG